MGCYPPGCSPCDRLYRCPSHIPWVIVAKAEVYLLSFLAYFLVQVTITPPGCSTCDRSYRCSHTLAVLDCLELVSYTLVPCRDDLSWLHIYEASSDCRTLIDDWWDVPYMYQSKYWTCDRAHSVPNQTLGVTSYKLEITTLYSWQHHINIYSLCWTAIIKSMGMPQYYRC